MEPEHRQLGALGGANEPAVERDPADRLPGLGGVLEHELVAGAALAIWQQRGADVVLIGTERTRRPLLPAWPPLVV